MYYVKTLTISSQISLTVEGDSLQVLAEQKAKLLCQQFLFLILVIFLRSPFRFLFVLNLKLKKSRSNIKDSTWIFSGLKNDTSNHLSNNYRNHKSSHLACNFLWFVESLSFATQLSVIRKVMDRGWLTLPQQIFINKLLCMLNFNFLWGYRLCNMHWNICT